MKELMARRLSLSGNEIFSEVKQTRLKPSYTEKNEEPQK